jgi:hypothetical protein
LQTKELLEIAARNTITTSLDPLLLVLARDYIDDSDLTVTLQKLFKVALKLITKEYHH